MPVFSPAAAVPAQILSGLAAAEGIDWTKWKVFFADERCVPLDHSDRYGYIVRQTASRWHGLRVLGTSCLFGELRVASSRILIP